MFVLNDYFIADRLARHNNFLNSESGEAPHAQVGAISARRQSQRRFALA
jgi:hypothetical protein